MKRFGIVLALVLSLSGAASACERVQAVTFVPAQPVQLVPAQPVQFFTAQPLQPVSAFPVFLPVQAPPAIVIKEKVLVKKVRQPFLSLQIGR